MFKAHLGIVFSILAALAYHVYVTALATKKPLFAHRLGMLIALIIGLIALAIGVKFLYCTIGCYFLGGCHYGR
jgi:hypothetical protein